MSEKITIDVPHKLGRDAARARIESGFAKVQEQIAGKSVEIDQNWQGDAMAFSLGAMGQKIAGRLLVEEERVHVEVDLPWLLAKLAVPVREKLLTGTKKLLEKKP